MQAAKPVKVVHLLPPTNNSPLDPTQFTQLVSKFRQPVVIRGEDLGPCREKWTPNYLIDAVDSGKDVKIHRSSSPQLDFRTKNFKYDTISFKKLVGFCSGQVPSDEFWYLRSLGVDPRGKDISDLSIHFPELFKDIRIPNYFNKEEFFSSVFRISSPSLQIWTHYDTCDNILIQIKGRKRVIFFPPSDTLNLYLDGDKSKVLNVDELDLKNFPDFQKVTRYETILEEGDIVFIPALWFHNITALEFSVSVNVFWKNLDGSLYDKKDTYGNKDLIPAQLAFKTFDKSISQLKVLPLEYEDFYLRRMIVSLQKRLDSLDVKSKNEEE